MLLAVVVVTQDYRVKNLIDLFSFLGSSVDAIYAVGSKTLFSHPNSDGKWGTSLMSGI